RTRLRAHEHELAPQFRPERERLLPEPQAPTPRHVHVGDDRVEQTAADGLQRLEAIGRGRDLPSVARQGASNRPSEGEVVVDDESREHVELHCAAWRRLFSCAQPVAVTPLHPSSLSAQRGLTSVQIPRHPVDRTMNPRVHRDAGPPTATFFLHSTERAIFGYLTPLKVNDRTRSPPQAPRERESA